MPKGIPSLPRIEDYEQFMSRAWMERIHRLAGPLRDKHVVHVNSTAYGGGVAELLNSTTILMNSLGIETGWRVLVGVHSFFKATRKMFDGLQGLPVHLTTTDKRVFHEYNLRNAVMNHLRYHDVVIIHDPQPLAMIEHYRKKCLWLWRCHSDLSTPRRDISAYLRPLINRYHASMFHMPKYVLPKLTKPTHIMPPAIDPLTPKNGEMNLANCERLLKRHGVPIDKPLLVQVARFDRWKDPVGVIETYRLVKKKVPCRLVLIGDMATDDPEGPAIYTKVMAEKGDDPDIILITEHNDYLVNALQRCATVVLQKSLREGFGLSVAEALWKGTPVVGSDVGGIPLQVINGKTGFLVRTPEEAAKRCIQLIEKRPLRNRLGKAGHDYILKHFLITREVMDYLTLIRKYIKYCK